jgi:DhnA family fructose-bisphosphate aldolase class Ia
MYRSLIEWEHELMPGEGVYVVYARDKQVWEQRGVDLTERKVNAAMLHAFTMGRALMKQEYTLSPFGEFRARAWYCSEKWCHAWDVCPAGGGEVNDQDYGGVLLPVPVVE